MAARKKPRESEEDEIQPLFPDAPDVDWKHMERVVAQAGVIDLPEDDSILRDEDMNDPELLAAYEELHREETAAAAAKAPPSARAPAHVTLQPTASAPAQQKQALPPPSADDEFAALEQWGSDETRVSPPAPTLIVPSAAQVPAPVAATSSSVQSSSAEKKADGPSLFHVRTQGLMPDFIVPPIRSEGKAKAAAKLQAAPSFPDFPRAAPMEVDSPRPSSPPVAPEANADPRRAELETQRKGWGRAWQDAKSRADAAAVKTALLAIKKYDAVLQAPALPLVLPTLPQPPVIQVATPAPAPIAIPVAAKPAAVPVVKPAQSRSQVAKAAAVSTRTKASAKASAPSASAAAAAQAAALSDRDITIPDKLELPKIGGILNEPGSEGEKYRDIEQILRKQVEAMHSRALEAKSSDDKVLAIQYYKLRRDLLLHYHHLAHLASLRLPLPPIICLSRPLQREVTFRHVAEDELEISVLSASSLPVPPGSNSIEPYVYIQFPYPNESVPLKLQTPQCKSSTTNPTWDQGATFTVRIERKRGGTFDKFVARKRVPIEVFQPRFLRTHVLLAKGELRLARLGAEAEVTENVALQSAFGGSSKAAHGAVQIRMRLRTPLNGRQFTSVEELITFFAPVHPNAHLLPPPNTPALYDLMPQSPTPVAVLNAAPALASSIPILPNVVSPIASSIVIPPLPAANPPPIPTKVAPAQLPRATPSVPPASHSDVVYPLPAKPAPTPSPSPSPVFASHGVGAPVQYSPSPAATKTAAPKIAKQPAAAAPAAEADELDIEEWESVENMVSNNVLEAEFTSVTKQVDLLHAQKKEVPEDLADRKNALEIKMKLLMIGVQTGQLSMEAYMEQLKKKAEAERKFAARCVALHTAEGKETAKRALIRAKIMEAELTEQAEEV